MAGHRAHLSLHSIGNRYSFHQDDEVGDGEGGGGGGDGASSPSSRLKLCSSSIVSNLYLSAPLSPIDDSFFGHSRQEREAFRNEAVCVVPFAWEEKPGTPKQGEGGGGGGGGGAGESTAEELREFEFGSSRFSQYEDAPSSPTPLPLPCSNGNCATHSFEEFRPLTPPPHLLLLPPASSLPPKAPSKTSLKALSNFHGHSYSQFFSSSSSLRSPIRKSHFRDVLFCCSSSNSSNICQDFKQHDYGHDRDPFLIAMNQLREEDEEKQKENKKTDRIGKTFFHRRTRSLSFLTFPSAASSSSSSSSSSPLPEWQNGDEEDNNGDRRSDAGSESFATCREGELPPPGDERGEKILSVQKETRRSMKKKTKKRQPGLAKWSIKDLLYRTFKSRSTSSSAIVNSAPHGGCKSFTQSSNGRISASSDSALSPATMSAKSSSSSSSS